MTIVQAQARITRLAATPAVHRAFHWLHLHQPQLRRWLLEILAIPAPTFAESARAGWFLECFTALGLSNPHIDAAGNALALLPSSNPVDDEPVILLSAHLDTVFPASTATAPLEDGGRILAPGACDNAAGLTGLLAIAAALRFASLSPPVPILFAANVGEEGEGDLRGMRQLFSSSPFAPRIRAAIALEGAGNSAVVTRALASRRLRTTVTGPGGHSWADAGAPNPILVLARALLAAESTIASSPQRTTFNVGQIAGGTAVNSIPSSASAALDLRSTEVDHLAAAEHALRTLLAATVHQAGPELSLSIDLIGDRPAGALPEDAPLLASLRAVDRHLTLRTATGIGSTDANIPLALGVPALAIGAGGFGGGMHTLAEWYDPTGRETALRRILLLLLDAATVAAPQNDGA